MNDLLLEIEGLQTHFFTADGVVRAVDGVDLRLGRGQTLGLVGESGCGKTVLSLSLLGLVSDPPGRIMGGSIRFDGRNLLDLSESELRLVRGRQISMIFQEPMAALNPVFTVGAQLAEVIGLHQEVSGRRELKRRVVEALEMVGIQQADKRVRDYPHQLSGGMCQRIMIAMAFACRPQLLIADEPTTALDVTTQAQILELMESLKLELGTSIIMVTHDLGVVAQSCQQVAVMYTGRVVENAGVDELFRNPLHPYTRGLLRSVPRKGASLNDERLYAIPGSVPRLTELPAGCSFCERCDQVMPRCHEAPPPVFVLGDSHQVRCWRYADAASA